jgi:hypothetical protein
VAYLRSLPALGRVRGARTLSDFLLPGQTSKRWRPR